VPNLLHGLRTSRRAAAQRTRQLRLVGQKLLDSCSLVAVAEQEDERSQPPQSQQRFEQTPQ
jgi:hypothetical protein